MRATLLVVDDETNIREGLAQLFSMEGYDVRTAKDGIEGKMIVDKEDIDVVITDYKMGRMSGLDLLHYIVSTHPGIPVIILTAHGSVDKAVEAMREGAFDFIAKPPNTDHLINLVCRALETRELYRTNIELKAEVESQRARSYIIGKAPSIKHIFDLIRKVAPTKASVLITGESGVGKELVADAIHNLSPRKDKPFIKVHCAALAESLLESELFGHEKGAFTGATGRKRGRFEMADGGTLFLDEIGEINQNVQIKILRVLQERKFERVGGEETIEVDVRLIAATNRDLKKEIAEGRFREDLYYRLNVVNIHVPPLRERREDIPLLAMAFLREFADENGKQIEGFDPKVRQALYTYDWPGNVRELRNCIESAVVMASGKLITLDDLPPGPRSSGEARTISIPAFSSLEEAERIIIAETLALVGGNKSKAAEILKIGRKTLYQKIEQYGIGKHEASSSSSSSSREKTEIQQNS